MIQLVGGNSHLQKEASGIPKIPGNSHRFPGIPVVFGNPGQPQEPEINLPQERNYGLLMDLLESTRALAIRKTPRNIRMLTYFRLCYALAANNPVHRPFTSGFKALSGGVVPPPCNKNIPL